MVDIKNRSDLGKLSAFSRKWVTQGSWCWCSVSLGWALQGQIKAEGAWKLIFRETFTVAELKYYFWVQRNFRK